MIRARREGGLFSYPLKIKPMAEKIPKPRKKAAPKNINVTILKPVAGEFLLPFNIGQKVSLPASQADEMIARGYAEKSK